MYVVNWSDPYSGHQLWEADGWFFFTVSRIEIIEATRPEVMYLAKTLPMVGLAMPVHDEPKTRQEPLAFQKMRKKAHEIAQKRY